MSLKLFIKWNWKERNIFKVARAKNVRITTNQAAKQQAQISSNIFFKLKCSSPGIQGSLTFFCLGTLPYSVRWSLFLRLFLSPCLNKQKCSAATRRKCVQCPQCTVHCTVKPVFKQYEPQPSSILNMNLNLETCRFLV